MRARLHPNGYSYNFGWLASKQSEKPCKDKDKEALFNVAYSVTDNISSRAILRHNNIFNRYLPALLYLPSTTPLYASISKGAASTIFYTFGMVRLRDSNPRPPAPKADILPTELSRQYMYVPFQFFIVDEKDVHIDQSNMLLFSSVLIDHVITILTTWIFIVVAKNLPLSALSIELSQYLREEKSS